MRTQIERAGDALFPEQGGYVGNIKFFTLNRGVTSEQLAEQLNRADAQIANGEAFEVEDIDGDLTA